MSLYTRKKMGLVAECFPLSLATMDIEANWEESI
jgi:hypothetical protein